MIVFIKEKVYIQCPYFKRINLLIIMLILL